MSYLGERREMICMNEWMGIPVDGIVCILFDIPRQLRLDCVHY